MKNLKYNVTTERAKEAFSRIYEDAMKMMQGGAVEVIVKRLSRSVSQNAHFHALINEIAHQVEEFYDKPLEVVKALLVDWFADEMDQQETPLKNPPQSIWDWRRKQFVSIRPSTTRFNVFEAGCFIEYLYAFGVEEGVQFSSPALAIYESYMEAQKK